MATNIKMLSFGDIIKFAREGAAITNEAGAAVVSKTVKPDGETPADWKDFCNVEVGKWTKVEDSENVFTPSPGVYRRRDVFVSMQTIDIVITGQEVNEIMIESMMQTGVLTDGTPGNVGSKTGQIKGWLQISRANQNDNVVLLAEVYGIINVKELPADGKRFKPEITFSVLHSTLNTVTSTLAAA